MIDRLIDFIYNNIENICSICAYQKECKSQLYEFVEKKLNYEDCFICKEMCKNGILNYFKNKEKENEKRI